MKGPLLQEPPPGTTHGIPLQVLAAARDLVVTAAPRSFSLAGLCVSDAAMSLVEQKPRWVLVPRGQAETLRCILKDSQYPWMSWYQQDLRGQLKVLASLRSTGEEEVINLPRANYWATRVSESELSLHVANVTQGRTLFCTCSKDTVRHPNWENE